MTQSSAQLASPTSRGAWDGMAPLPCERYACQKLVADLYLRNLAGGRCRACSPQRARSDGRRRALRSSARAAIHRLDRSARSFAAVGEAAARTCERGPFRLGRGHRDCSSVRRDDFASDVEPESHSGRVLVALGRFADHWLKDSFDRILRNVRPVVVDAHHDFLAMASGKDRHQRRLRAPKHSRRDLVIRSLSHSLMLLDELREPHGTFVLDAGDAVERPPVPRLKTIRIARVVKSPRSRWAVPTTRGIPKP